MFDIIFDVASILVSAFAIWAVLSIWLTKNKEDKQ